MNQKIFKYIVYLPGLPAFGFVSMYMLRPITEGAHDGGFLGMVFGLTVAQVIFSSWLTNLKWYLSIPFGLFLAAVTIYLSFWVIGIMRDIYNPIGPGGFFRDPDEQLENKLAWVFFVVLGLSSVALIAGLNKLTNYTTEKLEMVE